MDAIDYHWSSLQFHNQQLQSPGVAVLNNTKKHVVDFVTSPHPYKALEGSLHATPESQKAQATPDHHINQHTVDHEINLGSPVPHPHPLRCHPVRIARTTAELPKVLRTQTGHTYTITMESETHQEKMRFGSTQEGVPANATEMASETPKKNQGSLEMFHSIAQLGPERAVTAASVHLNFAKIRRELEHQDEAGSDEDETKSPTAINRQKAHRNEAFERIDGPAHNGEVSTTTDAGVKATKNTKTEAEGDASRPTYGPSPPPGHPYGENSISASSGMSGTKANYPPQEELMKLFLGPEQQLRNAENHCKALQEALKNAFKDRDAANKRVTALEVLVKQFKAEQWDSGAREGARQQIKWLEAEMERLAIQADNSEKRAQEALKVAEQTEERAVAKQAEWTEEYIKVVEYANGVKSNYENFEGDPIQAARDARAKAIDLEIRWAEDKKWMYTICERLLKTQEEQEKLLKKYEAAKRAAKHYFVSNKKAEESIQKAKEDLQKAEDEIGLAKMKNKSLHDEIGVLVKELSIAQEELHKIEQEKLAIREGHDSIQDDSAESKEQGVSDDEELKNTLIDAVKEKDLQIREMYHKIKDMQSKLDVAQEFKKSLRHPKEEYLEPVKHNPDAGIPAVRGSTGISEEYEDVPIMFDASSPFVPVQKRQPVEEDTDTAESLTESANSKVKGAGSYRYAIENEGDERSASLPVIPEELHAVLQSPGPRLTPPRKQPDGVLTTPTKERNEGQQLGTGASGEESAPRRQLQLDPNMFQYADGVLKFKGLSKGGWYNTRKG